MQQVNTTSKQLLFTTVRITSHLGPQVSSSGTGFVIEAGAGTDAPIPILMTNKHVIDGAASVVLHMIAKQVDAGEPDLGRKIDVSFIASSFPFVGHPDPDIDLAAVPLIPILGDLESSVYFRTIDADLLPTEDEASAFDALEEITFIGYPDGRSDPVHHTPIVRRGITATPMSLAFGGRPVFLVDGSVFGGSSGSPVFLFNQDTHRNGSMIVAGERLRLVGVMAETMIRNQQLPLTVHTQPHVRLAQELNLGVAFDWKAIDQTLKEVRRVFGM